MVMTHTLSCVIQFVSGERCGVSTSMEVKSASMQMCKSHGGKTEILTTFFVFIQLCQTESVFLFPSYALFPWFQIKTLKKIK